MTQGSLLLAAEGGGTALIIPEPAELIWGAITFAVVVVVLRKFAFPRLRETVEKREQEIQNRLEEAEKSRQEAQKQLDEYKKQVADARGEANRIIEEARQQAEQVRKELVANAEKEAEGIVQRAQEQMQAERTRTVEELQGTIAQLSIELAEKVVGRSLDGEAQRELVDSYIKEVAGMGGNGHSRS